MLGKTEGKRSGQKRIRWLDSITDSMDNEFEQTPRNSERQGSLTCYSPWGRKESNTTWQLNSNSQNYHNKKEENGHDSFFHDP